MAPPKIGLVDADRPAARAPLPTTDALFAQEVEQKMSNLLAGFGAVQSFLDRTKHRTATQLAAAETSPGTSKFESNLPGWEDSNFDVTQADRLGRGSQCGRDGDCGQETVQPNREDHSPFGTAAVSAEALECEAQRPH